VLGQFSEEVEGIEDLIVAGDTPGICAEQVIGGGLGEAMGPMLLGVVDDLAVSGGHGDSQHAGEIER